MLNKGMLNKGMLNKGMLNTGMLNKGMLNKGMLNKGTLNKGMLNKDTQNMAPRAHKSLGCGGMRGQGTREGCCRARTLVVGTAGREPGGGAGPHAASWFILWPFWGPS